MKRLELLQGKAIIAASTSELRSSTYTISSSLEVGDGLSIVEDEAALELRFQSSVERCYVGHAQIQCWASIVYGL